MKTIFKKSIPILLLGISMLCHRNLTGAVNASVVSPTVKLLDETGSSSLSGAAASVYMKVGGYYYSQGSTTNGALVIPNLASGSTYLFYVDYNHGRNYFSIVAGTDSAFIQTTLVSVNLKNCNGIVTTGSAGSIALKGNIDGYFWNMGNTVSGIKNMYLLPESYSFKMDYNHGTNTNAVSVSGTTQAVDFTAACVKITISNCNGIMASAQNPLSSISQSSPASFSMRRISAAYFGNLIQVRRSADNTTQEIGFTANGDLDTASLKTFVGTGSGFVTIWYDQSGNGRNASQSNTARQPRIVDAGQVERQNSQPAIRFLGMNYGLFTSTFTAYSSGVSYNGVAKVNSNNTYNAIVNKTGAVNKNVPAPLDFYNARFVAGNGSGFKFFDHTNAFKASEPMGIWTYQGTPGGNLNTFYNGSSNGSTSIGSSYSDAGQPLYIGSRADLATGLDGWISEIVTFGAEMSTADRQILEGSQASYYNVSGPVPAPNSVLAGDVSIKGNIDGYFWNMGSTTNSMLTLNLLTNSYDIRLDYNHGRNTQTGVAIAGSNQTVDFTATCVSVRLLDYLSSVITTGPNAGVAVKGNIDGYYWNMGNTTNGVLTMNLLPNSGYSFQMDYNHGRNAKTATISGSNQNVDFGTTRTTVKITDCYDVALAGAAGNISIKGNIDGYYWNMGNTTNGILALDLLPESYDFSATYNHYNSKTGATVITGSAQTVGFKTTLVTITGTGISFKGNVDGYFWSFTNSYMLPGNYVFKISGADANLVVSGCTLGYKPVIVKLLNSSGAGISGGVVDQYVSSWSNNVANTNASGIALVLFPSTVNNAYFGMNYANAKQQLGSYNINTTTTVTFQTKNVVVELRNSANALYNNEGISVGYYASNWNTFGTGTTASGKCNMELLPVNYYFRLTYANQQQQQGSINIVSLGANPTITFKTVETILRLKDAAGTGTKEATSLGYYTNNWYTFATGVTNGSGIAIMELLPGNYYFRMSYANQSQQKGSMAISTSGYVDFQTVNVTLKLKDAAGTGTKEATSLGYYTNNWHTFATGVTTGSGTAIMELLPGNYYFRMSYANQSQQKGSMAISASGDVDFQTVKVTQHIDDGINPIVGASADYYTNMWYSFGSTDASGNAELELLPGNYYFRINYASYTKQKGSMSISGTTAVNYTYTAGVGISRIAKTDSKNPLLNNGNNTNNGGIIGSKEKETIAISGLNCYPNPTISTATITYILFSDQNVEIAVYSANGALVKTLLNENQSKGTHSTEFSANDLAGGIYYVRVITNNGMKQLPLVVNK